MNKDNFMTIPWNREKIVKTMPGILLLAVAFVLLYEPWRLGGRDFFRLEGYYAAQTQEISWSRPIVTAHGVAIQNAYPLYPLLCSGVQSLTGLPVEFAMRIVSVLMTLASAVLVYISARLSRSTVAAQAAAAMFISCNIVMEKSLDAYPTSLVVFGVLSAQLLWFYFGAKRANWNAAWLSSLTVMALTFYAGGFPTLGLFFVPLVFMRRPLTLWTRLNKAGFYAGMLILLLAVLLWGLPYITHADRFASSYWTLGAATFMDYLGQLASVPFDVIVRFLPWTLIAWAPFCVALHPLDETPVFSRYLRIVVISTFFMLWLVPETKSFELMYMAGALSILTGLHYETAVRRYARQVRLLLKSCVFFCAGAALVILLFCFLPDSWFSRTVFSISYSLDFRHQPEYFYTAVAAVAAVAGMALIMAWGSRRNPVWVILLMTALSGGLLFWTVIYPYRLQDRHKRDFGMELRRALVVSAGENNLPEIVYKSNILDLYGECCYMGIPVKKIDDLNSLPKEADTVYLLNTAFPLLSERTWTSLLPADHTYMRHRVRLWRGDLRKNNQPNPKTEW